MLQFEQFGRKYKRRHPRVTHDLIRRKYEAARKLYFGTDDDDSSDEPQFSSFSIPPIDGEELSPSLWPTLLKAFRGYVLYGMNAYAEYATGDHSLFQSIAEDRPPDTTYASEIATRENELYIRKIEKEDAPPVTAPLNITASVSPKLQSNRGVFLWFSTYDNAERGMSITQRQKFFENHPDGKGIKKIASFENKRAATHEPPKDEQNIMDVTGFTPTDWEADHAKMTIQNRVYLECLYLEGPDIYAWSRLDVLADFLRKASETSVVCVVEVGLYAFSIKKHTAHANIVLVNGPARRLEYFEPHGGVNDTDQINLISKTAIQFFQDIAKLTGYTFVSPSEVCPVPIQTVEEGDSFQPRRDIDDVLVELNIRATNERKELKTIKKLHKTFVKFAQLRGAYCSFWTRMAVDLHAILAERGINASLRDILDNFMSIFPSNNDRFFIIVCYTIFVTDPNRIDQRIPSLYGETSLHARSASLFKKIDKSYRTTDHWAYDPSTQVAFMYKKPVSAEKIKKARYKTQREIRQGGAEVKEHYKSVEIAFRRGEPGETNEVKVTVNFDRNGMSVRRKPNDDITVSLVEPLWYANRDIQELIDILPDDVFTKHKLDRNSMRLVAYTPSGKKRVAVS